MRGSAAIHFVARNVLPSIEFDDEMTLHAREICEVRVDRMSAALLALTLTLSRKRERGFDFSTACVSVKRP